MQKFSTIVVGGGASGIVAAISARRRGASVVICERMPRLGKKLLASGAGRCNLLNEELDESHYNEAARPLVKSVFAKFGKERIADFFKGLGLYTYTEDDGRIFPVTNQSSSVLKVLEIELERLSIPVELDCEIIAVRDIHGGFILTTKAKKEMQCKNLILAGGGMSYPALGSNGGSYKIAVDLGHRLITPVPAAVPIVVKDPLCHLLQGLKVFAKARCVIDGKMTAEADGELLFAKYGLSGTAILDISRDLSVAINRLKKKEVTVSVDMAPFITHDELKKELAERMKKIKRPDDILAGMLPNRLSAALKDLLKIKSSDNIVKMLKDRRFAVNGTRGWNEAEFTAGGIATVDVSESLESKIRKNLFFSGETLDVDGDRGGYNLAWAWASGHAAGLTGAA